MQGPASVHACVTACDARGGAPPDTGAAGGAAHGSGSGPRTAHLGISADERCSRVSTPAQQASPPRRKSTATTALATDGAPRSGQACGTDLADGRRLARKHGGSASPPLQGPVHPRASHTPVQALPKILNLENPIRRTLPGPLRAIRGEAVVKMKTHVARAATAMLGARRYASRENFLARTRAHAHGRIHTRTRTRTPAGPYTSLTAISSLVWQWP